MKDVCFLSFEDILKLDLKTFIDCFIGVRTPSVVLHGDNFRKWSDNLIEKFEDKTSLCPFDYNNLLLKNFISKFIAQYTQNDLNLIQNYLKEELKNF